MYGFMIWFVGGIIAIQLAFATKFYAEDNSLNFEGFYPLIFLFSWTLVPLLAPAFCLAFILFVLRKMTSRLPELPRYGAQN